MNALFLKAALMGGLCLAPCASRRAAGTAEVERIRGEAAAIDRMPGLDMRTEREGCFLNDCEKTTVWRQGKAIRKIELLWKTQRPRERMPSSMTEELFYFGGDRALRLHAVRREEGLSPAGKSPRTDEREEHFFQDGRLIGWREGMDWKTPRDPDWKTTETEVQSRLKEILQEIGTAPQGAGSDGR